MAKRKMTIAALEKALQEKKMQLDGLYSERKKLLQQLAKLDKQIASLQGGVVGSAGKSAGGGRRKGPSLIERIVRILAKNKKLMTAGEIAEAVLAGGYETKSENLQTLIWSQIYKDERIVRPERGKFQLKPGVKIED